jgi:hypothetical protein
MPCLLCSYKDPKDFFSANGSQKILEALPKNYYFLFLYLLWFILISAVKKVDWDSKLVCPMGLDVEEKNTSHSPNKGKSRRSR